MMTQIASVSIACFRRALTLIAVLGLGAGAAWAQRVDNPYAFTTLAGTKSISGFANGTTTAAQFSSPVGAVVDSSGNIYVADAGNFVVRKVTPAGVVSTFAGTAGTSGNLDGTATGAKFGTLGGIAIDSSSNLYVTDVTNGTVRKITSGGTTSTLVNSGLNQPLGIAVDSANNVYVADSGNSVIRKISPAGAVSTFAGQVGKSGSATGAAASAQFGYPTGVAVDGATNVYVVDSQYSVILKIAGGTVSVLAGVPANPGYNDGAASGALFSHPYAIASDSGGDLFITDASSLVREISAGGAVSTLGGYPGLSGSLDGTGINARFNSPQGIAVTSGGVLFVADTNSETLRQGTLVGLAAPTIQFQPTASTTVAAGGTAILEVTASGASLSYQWYLNGAIVLNSAVYSGATTSTLTIAGAGAANAGNYTVIASNTAGSVTSAIAAVTVTGTSGGGAPTSTARLVNLSASATSTAGSGVLAAGFIVGGTGSKQVLLRGIGPTLGTAFSFSGVLPDPTLTWFNAVPTSLASNTVWGGTSTLMAAFAATGAFALPAGSADSALIETAAAGSYSIQVAGAKGDSGLALAEIYDMDAITASARLINISSRSTVTGSTAVLTAGFIIGGTGSEKVLIRGVGPSLANYGVTGFLPNPVITLFQGSTVIATNSGWGSTAALTTLFGQLNAFPLNSGSNDAAMVVTLPAGNYTVQVTGAGTSSGVALVEIYEDTF
jgi:Ig-like domain-containing protein/NHL repeat-containing protein